MGNDIYIGVIAITSSVRSCRLDSNHLRRMRSQTRKPLDGHSGSDLSPDASTRDSFPVYAAIPLSPKSSDSTYPANLDQIELAGFAGETNPGSGFSATRFEPHTVIPRFPAQCGVFYTSSLEMEARMDIFEAGALESNGFSAAVFRQLELLKGSENPAMHMRYALKKEAETE